MNFHNLCFQSGEFRSLDSLLSSRSHVEADTCKEEGTTCNPYHQQTGSGSVDVDGDKLETRQTISRTLSGTNT